MRKPLLYIFFIVSALMLSCQERKTSRADEFREEVRKNDSTELAQARKMAGDAERDVLRFEKLVTTYKEKFVFEKQEKYQTMGYWVLPAYQGSKERFTFFPEVEESGKMLLVSIDKQRRYSFTEVNMDGEDYKAQLPKGLSKQQLADVDECYAFARTMKQLKDAQEQQEKMNLKVRFYEEKIRRAKKMK